MRDGCGSGLSSPTSRTGPYSRSGPGGRNRMMEESDNDQTVGPETR